MNLQLDYAASIVLFQQLLGPLDTVHEGLFAVNIRRTKVRCIKRHQSHKLAQ